MSESAYHPFEWLFIVGTLGAFVFSFGTGSNDVANAFATSVGSGTLTMTQAIIIAAVFEFTGAMVLGQTNVNTIAGGIANRAAFNSGYGPYLFCYGMMCMLWIGGLFQLFSSFAQLNVSATHSVIGGIIGFALIHQGNSAVNWVTFDSTKVPPYGGVVPIIISWFFSPIFTGIVSYIIIVSLRTFVFHSPEPVKRSYFVLPIMIFITIWVNVFFVLNKGARAQLDGENWDAAQSAWVAAVCATFCSLLSIFAIPCIMSRVEERVMRIQKEEEDSAKLREDLEFARANHTQPEHETPSGSSYAPDEFDTSYFGEGLLTQDDRERIDHENLMDEFDPTKAEQFNHEAEVVFSYLQVCTAIAVIFAHGANEVGYATGPLSTIWDVINSTTNLGNIPPLKSTTVPPYWIIAICAVGLVSGLALYGQRLTIAVGFKLIKLSASRGFAAELATAIVITIAAQYGMPTSSSQCITGGIVGVGMAEGAEVGVNWRYFFHNFLAWLFTLVIMGLLTAALYSWGAYSPLENNP